MKYARSINRLRSIAQDIMQERECLVAGRIDQQLENALEDARIDAICAGVAESTIEQIIHAPQYID